MVLRGKPKDLEAGILEDMHQGPGREVRAMLVIDVPKGALIEDPAHVRDLEHDDGPALRGSDSADGTHKGAGARYVLQGHPAADEIRRILDRVSGKVLLLEDDIRRSGGPPLGNKARIVSNPPVAPEFTEQRKELALPAPYLDDILVEDAIPFNEIARLLVLECIEGGREALRHLVVSGVCGAVRLPGRIEYEGAIRTEGEIDVARREGLGGPGIAKQQATVYGNVRNVMEKLGSLPAAVRTAISCHDFLPPGPSIGLLPPIAGPPCPLRDGASNHRPAVANAGRCRETPCPRATSDRRGAGSARPRNPRTADRTASSVGEVPSRPPRPSIAAGSSEVSGRSSSNRPCRSVCRDPRRSRT